MKTKGYYKVIFLLTISFGIFGCSFRVVTPPSNYNMTETPEIIETSKKKIEFDVGHVLILDVTELDYFSPGFKWNLFGKEVRVSPFFTGYEREDSTGKSSSVSGGSISLKIPIAKNYLSGIGGAGVGFSDYGDYVSFDLGITLGYENRYFVPFINNLVYLSIPYNTTTIISPDTVLVPSTPPTTTTGWIVSGGGKLKISQIVDLKAFGNFGMLESKSSEVKILGFGAGLGIKF